MDVSLGNTTVADIILHSSPWHSLCSACHIHGRMCSSHLHFPTEKKKHHQSPGAEPQYHGNSSPPDILLSTLQLPLLRHGVRPCLLQPECADFEIRVLPFVLRRQRQRVSKFSYKARNTYDQGNESERLP